MKKSILGALITLCVIPAFSQSTYPFASYAVSGDTLYLTSAQISSSNFDTTGASITWNYSSLVGNGQQQLIYRLPSQTGFTNLQWPYIHILSNVNLSSTNNQTISIGPSLAYTNPNSYYLSNSTQLEQKASSYDIAINNTNLSIKNVYTAPDVLYLFPVTYNTKDSSTAKYTTNIPGFYYQNTNLKRVNHINGWGTVTTPYGTFTNALKVESDIMTIDSTKIDTLVLQNDTVYSREFKWLDPSKTYPVLYVLQDKIAGIYVTQTVQYLDNRKYFQPQAAFIYLPLAPITLDTVSFQNLTTNALSYLWNFDDPASGANNTSVLTNPQHIFDHPGTYSVSLIAYNGPLSDTIKESVIVDTIPTASFTYSPINVHVSNVVIFTNASINANNYKWYFGDPASGNQDSSYSVNPTHTFNSVGTYTVDLIAYSNAGTDTDKVTIHVYPTCNLTTTASATFNVSCHAGSNGEATAAPVNGNSPYTYSWSNSSTTIVSTNNPTGTVLSAGTYTVTVTDAVSCSATAAVTITQPSAALTDGAPVLNNNITCYGAIDGSATAAIPSGGTSPYTYQWNSGTTSTNVTNNSLAAATYTVNTTDANGCTAASSATVTITQPLALTDGAPALNNNITCYGDINGSATAAIPSGGTSPYTYQWNSGTTTTSTTNSSLSAGTYTVNISDAHGCTTTATSTVTITEPGALTIVRDSVGATVGCNGLAAVTPGGGTIPYTYFWTTGQQTSDTIKEQCAGNYCCTIQDNNGCSETVCITVASSPTGIENIGDLSSVIVYPNPVSQQLTVTYSNAIQKIEIENLLGQCMIDKVIIPYGASMQTINVQSLTSGIYFIKVKSALGYSTGKFVKE